MGRLIAVAMALACAAPASTVQAAERTPPRLPTPTMSRSDCDRLLWTIVDIDEALLGMTCGGLSVSKCLTAYMWLVAERDRLGRLYLANLCHYWSP